MPKPVHQRDKPRWGLEITLLRVMSPRLDRCPHPLGGAVFQLICVPFSRPSRRRYQYRRSSRGGVASRRCPGGRFSLAGLDHLTEEPSFVILTGTAAWIAQGVIGAAGDLPLFTSMKIRATALTYWAIFLLPAGIPVFIVRPTQVTRRRLYRQIDLPIPKAIIGN